MDPFVLSRNAFNIYCSEYITTNLSSPLINNNSINHSSAYPTEKTNHEKAIDTLNQRYKYFLQTLDRLRISFEQTNRNQNINSISNSTSTLSSTASKRSNKKRLYKSSKQRMPKVCITVSCAEHRTQQQPNIKMKR